APAIPRRFLSRNGTTPQIPMNHDAAIPGTLVVEEPAGMAWEEHLRVLTSRGLANSSLNWDFLISPLAREARLRTFLDPRVLPPAHGEIHELQAVHPRLEMLCRQI